ncbi:STN domain-containing protein [Rhodomicrobium lacus]|uniref:STN domain-containing protein n=1 Tax=Rhodomicrobium lacus TaxID=2498452 RepID=UPI000F8E8B5E|nr:STN domain-containing protein [Rhodomicrobium lacus]
MRALTSFKEVQTRAFLALSFGMAASLLAPLHCRGETSEASYSFSIPAQPLANALLAFSKTAGIEIYYKAAHADGSRSTAVEGEYTPNEAMRVLLRNTGFEAVRTSPGALTIKPQATALAQTKGLSVYEPYFAKVQHRISELLCNGTATAAAEEAVRIWIAPTGSVIRAESPGKETEEKKGKLAEALVGLGIGAPPRGMPQPINLIVFSDVRARQPCTGGDLRATQR